MLKPAEFTGKAKRCTSDRIPGSAFIWCVAQAEVNISVAEEIAQESLSTLLGKSTLPEYHATLLASTGVLPSATCVTLEIGMFFGMRSI